MTQNIHHVIVPPNHRVSFNRPASTGMSVIIQQLPHEPVSFVLHSGSVEVIIPAQIPTKSAINIEFIDQGIMTQPSSHQIGNSVLSLSISDWSALRVLPLISDELRWEWYTGSGVGMFLALLINAGASPSFLAQVFRDIGAPCGGGMIDTRNRFKKIEKWVLQILPEANEITAKDLKSEIFLPVINASTGMREVITKKTNPDIPFLSLCYLALANLLDFEPLVIKEPAQKDGPLSKPGVIWGFSALGWSCPDLSLFLYVNKRNSLNYDTFFSVPSLDTHSSTKSLKSHHSALPFARLDEIQRNVHTGEVNQIMPGLVTGYRLNSLPPVPYTAKVGAQWITDTLGDSRQKIEV